MTARRAFISRCIFLAVLFSISFQLCGCMLLSPAMLSEGDGGYSSGGEPIVGTWSYSHAYDTLLKMTSDRADSYFVKMSFYNDGSAVLVRDHGVSYLDPSEINGEWELIEELDEGRVYKVSWYTENTSSYFELFYLDSDDNGETVCAWNVQMPADEDVYLYYYRD